MITPFSKGIKRESENYLNKLFNFNDYFQLFFARSYCYSFLNRCSQVCLCARILDKSYSLFVLRFYGPVNPTGSCRARSVYLTTHLLGRLSPLSG